MKLSMRRGHLLYAGVFFWLLFSACDTEPANSPVPSISESPSPTVSAAPAWPSAIILFIGDGMGPLQVRAGAYYLGHSLCFESFPFSTSITTYSADSQITDSAAAATAIATGHKVNNGVISVALPGDGSPLRTVLEKAATKGMLTGLVTTTYPCHATPAAFGAHQPSRTLYAEIGQDLLNLSRPNLLFGGGGNGLDQALVESSGYLFIGDKAAFKFLTAGSESRVAALFGSGFFPYAMDGAEAYAAYPNLASMTECAIRLLDYPGRGFFLMVEGGLIDQACHINDAARMVGEVGEFDAAVRSALAWSADRADALILVTADHETGGILSVTDSGPGAIPLVEWSTSGHSSTPVGLYATGCGAWRFSGVLDNTEIGARLLE
jgi:alkaline phosphatase